MADEELRLNTLDRFRKTSSRMVLEAHSHCEVPAGCGGVVLRWRRPGAPLGVQFSTHIEREIGEPMLDGAEIVEPRADVAPGEHVFSFVVDKPGKDGFVLARLAFHPRIMTARRPTLLSRDDGSWRAALSEPAEGWRSPGFDDSQFSALIAREVPEPDGDRKWSWEYLKRDATGLGLSAATKRAWVRWVFRVDHEGFA